MKTVLLNIAAVLLGLVIGSVINMGLVMAGGGLIPPPPGVDLNSMEGLAAAIPQFEARHFLFPFLAHALGTLAGAYVACRVSAGRRAVYAYVVGCFFLAGGLANVVLLPGPLWFEITDMLLAYLPMAWLGASLAKKF